MTTQTLMTFLSSSTAQIIVPSGNVRGATQPLPAIDGANVSARITNPSFAALWVSFGAGPYLPAGADTKGSLLVPAGGVVLVPSTAGPATMIGVGASNGGSAGGALTFERGTITNSTFYDATSLSVLVS